MLAPLLCLMMLNLVSKQIASPPAAPHDATSQPAAEPEAVSLLGEPLYPMKLPPETQAERERLLAEAMAACEANNSDEPSVIWLGRRLAYLGRYRDAIAAFTEGLQHDAASFRLLRHRGHRYITVRRFDHAIADLTRAAELVDGVEDELEPDGMPNAQGVPRSTIQGNIFYHLGLAHYLKGDYGSAFDAYQRCLKLARNDDMRCATAYWLYLTLRRGDRTEEAEDLLRPFKPQMDVIENQTYHQLLLLYKGERAIEDLPAEPEGEGIDGATLSYGVAMWYLLNHPDQEERAVALLEELVAGPAWPAFGHIAAEAEVARMRETREEADDQSPQ